MGTNIKELRFHPEAAKRFDLRCQEVLSSIQVLRSTPTTVPPVDLHSVASIQPEHILAGPQLVYLRDAFGDHAGVYWMSGNTKVGRVGDSFRPIVALVTDLAHAKPFRDYISAEFVLNEACKWLCDTLERRRSDTLSECITIQSMTPSNSMKYGYRSFKPIHRLVLTSTASLSRQYRVK